jgi:autotransporter translocation and assembly factor TamB
VGKRLTENLQARYTYGIHTQAGGLVLEYRVSDALSIRSEAGTTSAIDLIFRREFD